MLYSQMIVCSFLIKILVTSCFKWWIIMIIIILSNNDNNNNNNNNNNNTNITNIKLEDANFYEDDSKAISFAFHNKLKQCKTYKKKDNACSMAYN